MTLKSANKTPSNATPAMPTRPKSVLRKYVSYGVLLVWFIVLAAAAFGRQQISDWWRLRDYVASPAVAALASNDKLTNYGQKVLYVNQPLIQDKKSFVKSCPSGTEQTVVLGCYHGGQNGIFILSVTDNRLNGIEQVTIAHEMLHAAYDRLSTKDRKSVNAMLETYYHNGLKDATIQSQIKAYQKSEPNDVVNEMHSLFGTQIGDLPSGLETYYQKYFTDRKAVAADYAQYQAEFTNRQAIIAQDDSQLKVWKAQITTQKSSLESQSTKLMAQAAVMQSQKNQGEISAYNAAVPGYNAAVEAYNAQVVNLRSLITQYNQLVESRNTVASESQELVNDISANVPTL